MGSRVSRIIDNGLDVPKQTGSLVNSGSQTVSPIMDITLLDLLEIEPRLRLARSDHVRKVSESVHGPAISWAVSARSTPPHLPVLRGGELLIVPPRVVVGLGIELAALRREALTRRVRALVVSEPDARLLRIADDERGSEILEWLDEPVSDAETAINRLLTECRGNLYRVGSELERHMSDLAASRVGIGALVQMVARESGLGVTVQDGSGRILVTALEDSAATAASNGAGSSCEIISHSMAGGAVLTLGPLQRGQRVVANFLVERIASAVTSALQRDDAARPRGVHREEATELLLAPPPGGISDQRAQALALGLDPDTVFFVAVVYGASDQSIARALAPLGAVHPSGGSNGRRAVLVASRAASGAESLSARILDIKRRWQLEQSGATLALSAPARGVASLPGAAREARFIANLQARAQFSPRAASFDSVDDVGALRLLYQMKDSNELRQFVSDALGKLENRDQRGTLRETLRAFLESGGSQVDASSRLGIHRNTLAYRLRRIGELVGRDVADPGSWLTLHLALRASEMLDVCADD